MMGSGKNTPALELCWCPEQGWWFVAWKPPCPLSQVYGSDHGQAQPDDPRACVSGDHAWLPQTGSRHKPWFMPFGLTACLEGTVFWWFLKAFRPSRRLRNPWASQIWLFDQLMVATDHVILLPTQNADEGMSFHITPLVHSWSDR